LGDTGSSNADPDAALLPLTDGLGGAGWDALVLLALRDAGLEEEEPLTFALLSVVLG